MVWNISIGDSAPGLGTVIDMQQPNPVYEEGLAYSGHNGQVCLIFRGTTGINPQPFCVALWVYGEEEPRTPEHFMATFDQASKEWRVIRDNMEGF